MEIVMRHEARQVPSWLIFDVGQKVKVGKVQALTLGSLAAPVVVFFVVLVYTRSAFAATLWSGFYLFICGLTGPLLVIRAKVLGEYEAWTPREAFMWPFLVLFLFPLWLACAAIAYDWRADEPIIRTISIALLFVGTLPGLYLWSRFAGIKIK